jgi:phospholipase C
MTRHGRRPRFIENSSTINTSGKFDSHAVNDDRLQFARPSFAHKERTKTMRRLGKLGKAARALATAAAISVAMAPSRAGLALAHGSEIETATPIEHLVVIFQENVSFDHYFATYPHAKNLSGEPFFKADDGTPTVNGLKGVLLKNNPNANNPANGTNAINPFRLSRSQASTCDQDHNYGAEQSAFDEGLMDLFPASTGTGESSSCAATYAYGKDKGLVMGYFDGNTVTALWNYAQNFAMSDNSYGTTFGPSTPGAVNLVAGNTYPATTSASTPKLIAVNAGVGTIVGDLDPMDDICSTGTPTLRMGGQNIGDLLNAKGISWGSFMGGFDLTVTNPNGTTGCNRSSLATPANSTTVPPPANNFTNDYIQHHAWFQYWTSTENPNHTRPNVPPSQYGTAADTGANHEYDIHDFFDALNAGNLPAVSILKAPANMDGHAGYSDPLLEQKFLVNTINAIQKSKFWQSTAIIISYDDSDGWYDHQMSPIINSSSATSSSQAADGDNLNGVGKCGNGSPTLKNADGSPIQGRCGYGPRLPLIVVSPWAKANFVDNTLTDQSSILRFIEDNWDTGRIGGGSFDALAGKINRMFDFDHDRHGPARRLLLDPSTGQPM